MSATTGHPGNAPKLTSLSHLLHSPRLWLAVVFVLSRAVYFAVGIRFDARPLDKFLQVFDPVLLRTRLFESLYYAHSYPQGYNLMIGLVLKVFPNNSTVAFHLLYLAFGIALMYSLFELLLALGTGPVLSTLLTSLFIASPECILYENFLAYEYPMLAMLCVAALWFYRLLQRPRALLANALFFLLAWLVVFRSIFHLGYFVLVAAVVIALLPGHRKMLALAAIVPFLLGFSTYAKNLALYGKFTNSSWLGFNIYTITTHQLTDAEMETFIREGKISPVERLETLGPLSNYRDFVTIPPVTGIPILDQLADSNGRPNFNQLGYFQLQNIYLTDGKYLLLHYPKAYFRSCIKAWFAYFLPATDFIFFTETRPHIYRFDRFLNTIVFGQLREASNRKDLRKLESAGASPLYLALYTGIFLMIGLPSLFLYGCWGFFQRLRKGMFRSAQTALLGFVLFHIVMITGIVNFLSCFENNRYRVPIDGFFLLLFGMACASLIETLRRRKVEKGGTINPVQIAMLQLSLSVDNSGFLRAGIGRSLFTATSSPYKKHVKNRLEALVRRYRGLSRRGNAQNVGANIGSCSVMFANAIDLTSHVYAFEPEPSEYGFLSSLSRNREEAGETWVAGTPGCEQACRSSPSALS
jgi:hypothetical protein